MRNKRMISDTVYFNDVFVSLSDKEKLVYTYLMLLADDDGVIDECVWLALSAAGAGRDALDGLETARFLLSLDDKRDVWAITHWLNQNYIEKKYYHHPAPDAVRKRLRVQNDMTYSLEQGRSIDEVRAQKAKKYSNNNGYGAPLSQNKGATPTSIAYMPDEQFHFSEEQIKDLYAKCGDNLPEIKNRIIQFMNEEGEQVVGEYEVFCKLAEVINQALDYGGIWPSNQDLSNVIYERSLAEELMS